MATLLQAWQAIRNCLISAGSGLKPPFSTSNVFIDTSPTALLGLITKGVSPYAIGIFDMPGMSHDTLRWHSHYSNTPVVPNPLIQASFSNSVILSKGILSSTATIFLSGSIQAGDGIGFNILTGPNLQGSSVTVQATDTLATLATRFATNINNNTSLQTLCSAVASGSTIVITSLVPEAWPITVNYGGTGSIYHEYTRECHYVQISVYTRTYQDRSTAGEVVRQAIAQLYYQATPLAAEFLNLPDGSWMRVTANGNKARRDLHSPDIYVWDFVIGCDIAITVNEPLFSVLVEDASITPG